MKTKFEMHGVYGTPYTDEDMFKTKANLESSPDVLAATFVQHADGQYRFLVTFITEE
jgi:hypothetical protein